MQHKIIKKIIFLFLFSTLTFPLLAQESATCFRIQLKDKNSSPYSINRPEEFLSSRAISNKSRYNIAITEEDLPVNPQYKQEIFAIDTAIKILTESKWQNTVVIYCPDSISLENVKNLSFTDTAVIPVAAYRLGNDSITREVVPDNVNNMLTNTLDFDTLYDYGQGWAQIAFHNGHRLHEMGFYGDGMLIAVMDGGWTGFDSISYFQNMYENGQLVGTRDLIPEHNNIYDGGSHGTSVTSIMASAINGQLIGTAPHANYFFILSEHPYSEQLIEEDFWAQAAEIADSLGADVINTSLGYTTFIDFPQGDFTYESCDGVTSIASRNASLACQKGIVVCIAAGNEGYRPWHYLAHPADAVDVICVGAARASDSVMAPFSSYGPSYDGRVKPDAVSVGWDTYVVRADGSIAKGDGTSFACPTLAGLTACLRQALPHKNAMEITDIIRQHGHQYNSPDSIMGYGIPDMYQAYLDNALEIPTPTKVENKLSVYPNPCSEKISIIIPELSINHIDIYDVSGKLIISYTDYWKNFIQLPVNNLQSGFYLLRIKAENNVYTAKFIKQ